VTRLSLSLLGPFRAALDGQPVTGFKSNKVRALLAYLAVRADRFHRRDVLAGLLWPEWPNGEALSNLRYALSNLRQVIGDRRVPQDLTTAGRVREPLLLTTRTTIQFNREAAYWLDVAAFEELSGTEQAHPNLVARLEDAAALYRGDFLEGFSLGDSPGFEEWTLLTREQLARTASSTLHRLAEACQDQGDLAKAQSYAWRQLELEPWDEVAHRQVMRALALSGQRSAALAQFDTCKRFLAQELAVEPGLDTVQLYTKIRDGLLSRATDERGDDRPAPTRPAHPPIVSTVNPPAFLCEEQGTRQEAPIFVARERERDQLAQLLDHALAGRGRVAFITGDAGSGKTSLIRAFVDSAQERHADLVAATASCNAYTGIGDPYAPFRQILGALTGDVEARWTAGVISSNHAHRLWRNLPLAVEALVEQGAELIDTFVPRTGLLERAATFAHMDGRGGIGPGALSRASGSHQQAWLRRLTTLLAENPPGPVRDNPRQFAIFEQWNAVLHTLARRVPLVLVLDDLQWSDAGSIDLLFHLGRQLMGSRILILGAYRPEEIALGRHGERHPLDRVVNELQRTFGDAPLDLDQAESRTFVEALLDTEPNTLGTGFRDMLHRQTRGHPLFTIELLRGLQDRGDLSRNHEGRWSEGPELDWETLPGRVEAVIAERVSRLDSSSRAALQLASVEGEVFTAEMLAQVLGTGERQMVDLLSRELDREHRIIRAHGVQRANGQLLSRYRFRHILFQKYLYSSLDEIERVYLHERVGTALENLYDGGEHLESISLPLALHFEKAKKARKAVGYLHRAAEAALQLAAYAESIAHLTKALALLKDLPASRERAETELSLQISLIIALTGRAPGVASEQAAVRARELSRELGKTRELWLALGQIVILEYVRAEYPLAHQLALESVQLAREVKDPLLIALAHWQMGFITFGMGDHAEAREHLEHVIASYDAEAHHVAFVRLRGVDPGVSALAYHASCLWCLGYPDQAAARSQEALDLARRLGHPFSLADVICFGGCVFNQMRRDAPALRESARELIHLSGGMGLTSFLGTGAGYLGEALVELGDLEVGMQRLREGIQTRRATATRCFQTGTLAALARAEARAGSLSEAHATLRDALDLVEETGERYCQPELHRLEGELLLARGDRTGAEASFLEAAEVARRQSAKSWELRATVSLCRLWQAQGRREEAQQRLAAIYNWFTEGLDTPDLVQARTLLESLHSPPRAQSQAVM